MKPINIYRVVREGFYSFWRNVWLSLAATAIMVITLFTISVLVLLNLLTNLSLQTVKDKVDISVFLKPDASEEQITNIQQVVSAMPQVKSVVYVSKDQALSDFRDKHKDNPTISQSIDELTENPLFATIEVKTYQLSDYTAVAQQLGDPQYSDTISKVNFEDNKKVIDRLSSVTATIQRVGVSLSLIFVVTAILVMFNTIRLTIYTRREEIEIMQLVGATDWFIRGPFILEGILYGVFATVITLVLLYPILNYFSPGIAHFLDRADVDMFVYFKQNLGNIILLQLGIGALLGVLSSTIAIRRYLKL